MPFYVVTCIFITLVASLNEPGPDEKHANKSSGDLTVDSVCHL